MLINLICYLSNQLDRLRWLEGYLMQAVEGKAIMVDLILPLDKDIASHIVQVHNARFDHSRKSENRESTCHRWMRTL